MEYIIFSVVERLKIEGQKKGRKEFNQYLWKYEKEGRKQRRKEYRLEYQKYIEGKKERRRNII